MQGYNHIAGGLTFTAIFASFHDVNVFERPLLVGTTLAFSILPDIDHTRSWIGKAFYPVASWLQTRYGHRTITHSLPFFLACVGLLWLFPQKVAVCGSYALGSHLLFDMCTRQGVPLLYPFSKRPFVLPANPALRLSGTDFRSEVLVFVVFCVLFLFCRPLFANGFWTTYNRAFATWAHVERESRRSADLLRVAYVDAQRVPREGLFYRREGSRIVLLTAAGFEQFSPDDCPLSSFEHSGRVLTEQRVTLSGVPLDSLNRLLTGHCARVQVQSTQEMMYFDGPLMRSGKGLDLEYRKNLLLSFLPTDDRDIRNRIELLRLQRDDDAQRYAREMQQWRRQMQKTELLDVSVQELAAEFDSASNYRKGQIIRERAALETQLKTARFSEPLEPLPPNFHRADLELDALNRQLRPHFQLSANLIILSWK